MAHFAKLEINGKVIEVIKINNEVILDANGNESEVNGVYFLTKLTGWSIWKQTSYNQNFRKNFAGIGMTYDEDRNAFIKPQPYVSWVLNETTCRWEAPTAYPNDNNRYEWNEETTTWDLME